jgi:hypothetical protein
MVQTFKTGIYYTAKRDEKELDYGWIEAVIGPVKNLTCPSNCI